MGCSGIDENEALSALLLLYREVLQAELGFISTTLRVQRPAELSVVFTQEPIARSP